MIQNPKRRFLFLLYVTGLLFQLGSISAQVTTGVPLIIDVGNSNDTYVSYLVIDDQSLGNRAYEYAWHYSSTYEAGTTNPLSGDDLINAIVAGTTNTSYALTPITEGNQGIDYGIDGFQIGSQTSTVVSLYSVAPAYWSYWIKGGSQTESYYPYATVSPTNWLIAADWSADRLITNGSFDGWTLNPYNSSTYESTGPSPLSAAAVPESSTFALFLLSLASIPAIVRWKKSIQNPKA